jgi:membrane glycosyltransferase
LSSAAVLIQILKNTSRHDFTTRRDKLDVVAQPDTLEQSGQTAPRPPDAGLADAVLDPYVNAVHVSLLREKGQNPAYAQALADLGVGKPEVRTLCEKLLTEGPEHLRRTEKLLILSDAEVLPWLHRQAWLRPSGTLARWWQEQIRQHAR